MRFATATDRPFVEAVLNDPTQRLWKSFDGAAEQCSADAYLAPPSFTLVCDDGCFPIQALGDGRYAVHANLLPICRGARAVSRSQQARDFIFDNTDARELVAFVPATNPQARWVASQVGFKPLRVVPKVWPVEGRLYDLSVLRLIKPTAMGAS